MTQCHAVSRRVTPGHEGSGNLYTFDLIFSKEIKYFPGVGPAGPVRGVPGAGDPVRLRHHVLRSLPPRPALRPPQQHHGGQWAG